MYYELAHSVLFYRCPSLDKLFVLLLTFKPLYGTVPSIGLLKNAICVAFIMA